jgi:Fe-S cluster biogenesis protein NfuA
MTQDDIQKFIDEDVNPALASHGGFLLIHNFDDEKKLLKVEMGGGCQGCASARITLKLQIEGFLKEEFPELTEIEDVTDHIAGTNPYY